MIKPEKVKEDRGKSIWETDWRMRPATWINLIGQYSGHTWRGKIKTMHTYMNLKANCRCMNEWMHEYEIFMVKGKSKGQGWAG